MKLVHCPHCGDVFNVEPEVWKQCTCEKVKARRATADGHEVEVSAGAIVIGIPNESFRAAVKNRPRDGRGIFFSSYVLPQNCTTVKIAS